ncbi:MAG: glycerophosphodiester phosphodiesterase [Bacteroidota bacterium]
MKIYFQIFVVLIAGLYSGRVAAQQKLAAPRNGEAYVIAHRGAHNGIPENSLAAYQKAIDLGCDFVEIDVRTTKDGQLVSVHNNSIDAYVQGQTGKVKDLTLMELKALDIGARVGEEWKNTRIPTLEEILKVCQGKIGIYLDLKDADPGVIIPLLRKYDMADKVVWFLYGLDRKNLKKIKNGCPECIPMPDPGPEMNLPRLLKASQFEVIGSGMRNYSKSFGEKAHNKGCMVFVDDSENDLEALKSEWIKMLEWKADGIQTDQPEELIKLLKSRG